MLSSIQKYDHTILIDPDIPDARWVVSMDDYAESPAAYRDETTVHVYRAARGYSTDIADHALSETFQAVFDESRGDDELALKVTRRYARVILGWTIEESEERIITANIRGYAQSEWKDILVIVYKDGYGTAEGYVSEYRQWFQGDVWCVTREERIECDNEDSCHGSEESHWEIVESCGGIYADDAESALIDSGLYYSN